MRSHPPLSSSPERYRRRCCWSTAQPGSGSGRCARPRDRPRSPKSASVPVLVTSELPRPPDRKSVVSGKSVSVRVDLGGRRIIKKKKHYKKRPTTKKKNN